MHIDITDPLLVTQLSALAEYRKSPVEHVIEYAIYRYLLELVNDIPNITVAVPELASVY